MAICHAGFPLCSRSRPIHTKFPVTRKRLLDPSRSGHHHVRVDPNRLAEVARDLGLNQIDCPSCRGSGRLQEARGSGPCGVCCGSGHLWRSPTVCATDAWLEAMDPVTQTSPRTT